MEVKLRLKFGIQQDKRDTELSPARIILKRIWNNCYSHYRRAVGALLVYDVTKEKSFESVTKWMEELKYHAEPDIVIMLVGNKVDLVDKNPSLRKVSREEARKLAQEHQMLFEETSAVTAQNVTDVFERLLQGKIEDYLCAKVNRNFRHQISGQTQA